MRRECNIPQLGIPQLIIYIASYLSIYLSIHPPPFCQKEIQRTLLDMDILLNEK